MGSSDGRDGEREVSAHLTLTRTVDNSHATSEVERLDGAGVECTGEPIDLVDHVRLREPGEVGLELGVATVELTLELIHQSLLKAPDVGPLAVRAPQR